MGTIIPNWVELCPVCESRSPQPGTQGQANDGVDRPIGVVDERRVDDLCVAELVGAVCGVDVSAGHQPWPHALQRLRHGCRANVFVAAGADRRVTVTTWRTVAHDDVGVVGEVELRGEELLAVPSRGVEGPVEKPRLPWSTPEP